MKKVGLLTDFMSPDPNYSLNIVAEEQIGMLVRGGYSPVAVASDGFIPERNWKLAEMRYIPGPSIRMNHIEEYPERDQDVQDALDNMAVVLGDLNVILTHDLIYQAGSIVLNMAARKFAEQNPHIRWLNWVHSATASPVWNYPGTNTHFPNSVTVYPNEYDLKRVGINFKAQPNQLACVPHPTDVVGFLGLDPMTANLIHTYGLLSADAILVYPVRLDRGKQVEHVLRVAAGIKKHGRSAKAIVIDFHSTGGDKVTYREELKQLGLELGLSSTDFVFTSEFDKQWEHGVPRHVVRDLMLICNVFVMPSVSETYSLITQEAALSGAFLVLNRDFPAFRNIYGEKAAYYQFSSAVNALTGEDGNTTVSYTDIDGYFSDITLRVIWELTNNPVLAQKTRVRKTRNPDYVFKQYLEPLFYA